MIYDIGPSDIDQIPKNCRLGNTWHIWFPEETDVLIDQPKWKWILEEPHQLMGYRDWPTYWLFRTAQQNQKISTRSQSSLHFALLVRKPHPHRVRLMQGLYNGNLLKHGVHSWLDHKNDCWTSKSQDWNPPVRQLDNMQDEEDMWTQPIQVGDTAISLIFETTDNCNFITEKTFIPIHNGRMILPYGGPGMVETLKSWGFVFPKFFDFDYDQDLPSDQRESLYVNSVKKIINLGTPERLRRMCEPYAEQNKKVFNQIVADGTGVPVFNNVPAWALQMQQFIKRVG